MQGLLADKAKASQSEPEQARVMESILKQEAQLG